MKKLFVVIGAAFILLSCDKEAVVEPKQSLVSTSADIRTAKVNKQEIQTLIRSWAEWVYGRNSSVAPFLDPNGSLQDLNQPFTSGVFMLGGGSSPEPVTRTVTISLSQYQFVFVPLVVLTGFFNQCIPGSYPNNPEAYFQSQFKEGLNGPKDLTLLWDDVSLLSTKQKDARTNSGLFNFHVDPSYFFESNQCLEDFKSLSVVYADGYWAKIPLTLGTHTLTVGGNFDLRRFKYEFSNMVNYTIHVVE
ncbi:hypothetical protein [Adhaeribacter radiodurans]|uniref:Uncharacterized protein n=1 Tax=Adhaeribacter radiodurans TaxID=2745197 RepID=A0A7L7LCS0_9BACT|nr:hypothetical protein [Adhaeribacter radiodurans]QMU30573.1 hypothetical protein HUW48_22230 [Adhaeribacter radiodurans]